MDESYTQSERERLEELISDLKCEIEETDQLIDDLEYEIEANALECSRLRRELQRLEDRMDEAKDGLNELDEIESR